MNKADHKVSGTSMLGIGWCGERLSNL